MKSPVVRKIRLHLQNLGSHLSACFIYTPSNLSRAAVGVPSIWHTLTSKQNPPNDNLTFQRPIYTAQHTTVGQNIGTPGVVSSTNVHTKHGNLSDITIIVTIATGRKNAIEVVTIF